jgi:formamidopyrimidine-DNA glycosylase
MPELPDITVYLEALERHIGGERLDEVRLASPFLLRSVAPPIGAYHGTRVTAFRRLGKRIAIGFEKDRWMVLHLMIAGRLHWGARGKALPGKRGLAGFDFENGSLVLTEAGSKKRASLHLVEGAEGLDAHDPGGLEVMDTSLDAFRETLIRRNHTLKRALTDPRLFSGIGNAYSDEILHRARLSPIAMSQALDQPAIARLHAATQETLADWIARLRADAGDGFPEKVTAFRDGMAVHGRYGKPCPVCETAVQRIRYASNETNYCPRCQTDGRVLADRSLSRLLKKDWPRSVDELERMREPTGGR